MLTVEAAYQRFFPLVREKCRRMLLDSQEAQDVAQETFVKLWQKKLPLDQPQLVLAWSYRTSTRLAIDRLRGRRALRQASESHDRESPKEIWSSHAVDARRLFEKLATKIPAEQLEAAVLARVDGLTQTEIAEVLKCTDRTVRRLLERFERNLAAHQEEA